MSNGHEPPWLKENFLSAVSNMSYEQKLLRVEAAIEYAIVHKLAEVNTVSDGQTVTYDLKQLTLLRDHFREMVFRTNRYSLNGLQIINTFS